jgi:hypothetical protein
MAGDQWSWIKGLCIPRSRHESKHLSVNDLTSCLMGMFIRGKMDAAHGLSQAGTNAWLLSEKGQDIEMPSKEMSLSTSEFSPDWQNVANCCQLLYGLHLWRPDPTKSEEATQTELYIASWGQAINYSRLNENEMERPFRTLIRPWDWLAWTVINALFLADFLNTQHSYLARFVSNSPSRNDSVAKATQPDLNEICFWNVQLF